jgi:glycosyltransferase involved in cell wall biosynthesis
MKVVIQIPCYNEEETLGVTLRDLPRDIPGIDCVEWLVVDDGSRDNTVAVARECGADHVISSHVNRGLARAFMTGIDYSLKMGADIIVNTDADNQYNAQDIALLVAPIVNKEAEIVVGARPIDAIKHWSWTKKLLQKVGSWVVRLASGTNVPDAPSGFRAMSRDCAIRLNVFGDYTYTLETIIQAGRKNMKITSVPVRTNPDMRPSRLVSSNFDYIKRSFLTITRIFMTYRPFRFFAIPGFVMIVGGLIPSVRFLYYWWNEQGAGHVQSLQFAVLLLGTGIAFTVVGLLADLIGVNRMLLEDIRTRIREIEYMEHKQLDE